MTDESDQNASWQPETRSLAPSGNANPPVADRRDAHLLPVETEFRALPLWQRDPATRRRHLYGITLIVPLLLLAALIFGMQMSPLAALLVSALTYAGLFLMFVWKPQPEIEHQAIAEEVRESLAASRRLIARIQEIAPAIQPLFKGSDGGIRLERIGRLADRALAVLVGNPATSLGTADRLETRLSEFSNILDLFRKTSGVETAPSLSHATSGKEVEETILPLMERWLEELATSLGAEDALNLDIAMRVMRDTLESEGLSRTE